MILGLAQVGTMAAWTDDATVATGPFTTGTLDLTVGEGSANQLSGQGGTWTHTNLTLSAMSPGESVARQLVVSNGGTVPLRFNGTLVASNNDLYNTSTPGLQVTVVEGGSGPSNSGTQAAANRSGTCGGTTTATSLTNHNVSTTAANVHSALQQLNPSATKTYCVRVALASTSPNSMQGKSTVLTFAFNAQQLS